MKRLIWIIAPAALLQGCAGAPPLPPGPDIPGLGPGSGWLLLVLLLGAAFWMARRAGSNQPRGRQEGYRDRDSTALIILKERYAKSEITGDEYLRMLADLQATEEAPGARR